MLAKRSPRFEPSAIATECEPTAKNGLTRCHNFRKVSRLPEGAFKLEDPALVMSPRVLVIFTSAASAQGSEDLPCTFNVSDSRV